MALSPTTEGFRAAFRRPSLTLAEISWRWVVGATTAAVCVFGLVEYLDTLPVTNGELLFLRSRQPYLVGEAIAHILRGSLNRAVLAGNLVVFLLASLWIIAASVGRIATVRGLLEHFRKRAAGNLSASETVSDPKADIASPVSIKAGPLRALTRLNFLRVAVTLAGMLGFIGASILASLASPDGNPRPGASFFLFLTLAALVFYAWSALNWLLSLSGIFAVRDDVDAMTAIVAAVTLCRERGRAVSAVGAWTGLAHLVAFVGAAVVISMPLGLLALVSWRLAIAITILGTLAYFALADWLYVARLAGYVCIVEMPAVSIAPLPRPANSAGEVKGPALQTTLDQDETILSDVPGLMPAALAVIDAKQISDLVELELSKIIDPKLLSRIRELMVFPYAVEREWDYGAPGEHFTCWTVLEHRASNTGIALCERGFGPKRPWGLVSLSGPYMSIGMDSGWFASLEGAMRDSMAWDEPNPEGYEVQ